MTDQDHRDSEYLDDLITDLRVLGFHRDGFSQVDHHTSRDVLRILKLVRDDLK